MQEAISNNAYMLVYERKQAQPSQADAGPASPVKAPTKEDKVIKKAPVDAPMISLDREVIMPSAVNAKGSSPRRCIFASFMLLCTTTVGLRYDIMIFGYFSRDSAAFCCFILRLSCRRCSASFRVRLHQPCLAAACMTVCVPCVSQGRPKLPPSVASAVLQDNMTFMHHLHMFDPAFAEFAVHLGSTLPPFEPGSPGV
jgi:hypothetical protein